MALRSRPEDCRNTSGKHWPASQTARINPSDHRGLGCATISASLAVRLPISFGGRRRSDRSVTRCRYCRAIRSAAGCPAAITAPSSPLHATAARWCAGSTGWGTRNREGSRGLRCRQANRKAVTSRGHSDDAARIADPASAARSPAIRFGQLEVGVMGHRLAEDVGGREK